MTDKPQGSNELTWELPARDRRGRFASLGPISLGLGVLCWLTPLVGAVLASLAVGCGVVSVVTRREYRVDWIAVVGICLGGAQLFFELVLFTMSVTGL